ncbi:Latrophilin-2 [Dirofilaria immitis]|nr:Latrophilin-2 [Dirofilaria immitis]
MLYRCNGHTQCSILVNEGELGDPCPDTAKYLDVEFKCIKTTISTSTATINIAAITNGTFLISDITKSAMGTAFKTMNLLENDSEQLFCDKRTERDIDWPRTEYGMISRMPCPIGSTGYAEWICGSDGLWESDGPDLSRCVSTWSKGLLMDAEEADGSLDRLEFLREIQQRTRREPLIGGDLIALSRAIKLLIPTTVYNNDADKFIELVVESVNNMAKESQSLAWNDLKVAKRRMVADLLMDVVDQVSMTISGLVTPDTPRIIMKPNTDVELEISAVRVYDYVAFPSTSLYRTTDDSVNIPREALTLRNNAIDEAKVLYVAYSSIGKHLEPEVHQGSDGTMVSRKVASKIVSISAINSDNKIQIIDHLRQPVIITFSTEDRINLSTPQCVWWNRTRLQWSSYGCIVNLHNKTHTVCHCNHLTYFAVLMDIHYRELSTGHNIALTFITYAGCTLSIICLLLSLFAFQCFGSSGGDRIFIHKNLCFSLLVAEAVFLGGIWQTQNSFCCSIVAGVLHYFFLAAFSWMLLEGFELYYMLVEVFQSKDSKRSYILLFGYGFPLLIIVLSIWYDRFSYGTERYCWLRSDNYFILAFIGPVAIILLCNTVFLVMTLFIVCSHSSIGYTPCKQDRDTLKNVRNWLKGSIALITLLGLTWTFGFLWIDEQSIIMAYAFTIMNSLQGLFIFLFHVAFNDRLHKDYRKWVKHSSWALNCMRDNSSHTSRTMPYLPASNTSKTGQAVSSSSSTASELLRFTKYLGGKSDEYSPFLISQRSDLTDKQIYIRRGSSRFISHLDRHHRLSFCYPSMSEKYPALPTPRMVAAIDPRYNNSVQMLLARQRRNPNALYDYATISYDDLCTSSSNYYHQSPQNQYYFNYLTPATTQFSPPPPPQISSPPLLQPASTSLPVTLHSSIPISSASIARVSDDSAYSDSSSSTLQCHGEVVTNRSGMLLRMDLSKNPPVFMQGL